MRKFLLVLGALTFAVILAAGAGFGILIYKGVALDAESKTFVDKAVPPIIASLNKEQFLDRTAPELRNNLRPGELNGLFEALSRLGPLIEYQGATGGVNMAYTGGVGGSVSASYVANAKFKDGNATMRIALLKRDGRWMISGFHVDTTLSGAPSRGT